MQWLLSGVDMIYCDIQKVEVPLIVPFGGGVNSTAMVLGAIKYGHEVDVVVFADTGGEKPETYAWVQYFSDFLELEMGIPIHRVQSQDRQGEYYTLENKCIDSESLPSLAYGWKSCSDKHKVRPVNKFLKHLPLVKDYKSLDLKPVRWIGYDLDEEHRFSKANMEYPSHTCQFPLLKWELDREGCIDLIKEFGFKPPIKSACFFCPASKKDEIWWLYRYHPELFDRAVAMERNANLTSIKGLGRRFNWEEYVTKRLAGDPTAESSAVSVIAPCDCVD